MYKKMTRNGRSSTLSTIDKILLYLEQKKKKKFCMYVCIRLFEGRKAALISSLPFRKYSLLMWQKEMSFHKNQNPLVVKANFGNVYSDHTGLYSRLSSS